MLVPVPSITMTAFHRHHHELSRKRRRRSDSWTEEPAELPHDHDHAAEKPLASNEVMKNSVAPFLTKHIRDQHTPMTNFDPQAPPTKKEKTNSRYCYRHDPDLKCKRQADEQLMDELQRVLFFSWVFWLKFETNSGFRTFILSQRVTSRPWRISGLSSRPLPPSIAT